MTFHSVGNVIIPTDPYFSEGFAATTNKRPCLLDQPRLFQEKSVFFSRRNQCFFPEFLVKPRSPSVFFAAGHPNVQDRMLRAGTAALTLKVGGRVPSGKLT